MSPNIMTEARLLILSVGAGVGLALFYAVIRLLRRIVRHGWMWVGLEDLAYWIIAGFAVFYLLYRENDGAFRLYVVGTVLLAMAVADRVLRVILGHVYTREHKYLPE